MAGPRAMPLLPPLLPLLLLLLLTATLCLSATAGTDRGLPEHRHDVRWQGLDLWPKLLHIRRQFDRDGYPRQDGSAVPAAVSPGHGILKTLELDTDEIGSRTAVATRRLQHSSIPSPRDEAVARTIGPLMTPIANKDLSQACLDDSTQYLYSIFTDPWALRMFDATGKLPDGVLLGNTSPFGNWDECLNTTAQYTKTNSSTGKVTQHSFSGKYCLTYLSNAIITPGPANAAQFARVPRVGLAPIIPILPDGTTSSVGVCIPSSCSSEELVIGLNIALKGQHVGAYTTADMCHILDEKTEFSAGAIVMITILSIVGFLMLVGTIVDVLTTKFAGSQLSVSVKRHIPLLLRKVLTAFSVYTNGRKLLDTSSTKDTLSCLHGIRFLSNTWVILGHTYFFLVFFSQQNIIKVYSFYGDWFFFTIANATVSVDSFFFLSGLLVAYIAMRSIERANGKLNILMYYVHRYIRLTPLMMAVIGFVATLEPYLGSGPVWSYVSADASGSNVCRDNWWKNMLYINNLVDMDQQCIGQTWYLANDMQMFLFSPLILLPLYHWPVMGQLWLIFLVCFFTGINAMVTVVHKLGPNSSLPDGDDFNLRYMKPWTRAGPYLVGLYMGWVLHKIRGRKIVIPAPVVAIGWLTASLTGCLIVYGLFGQPTVPPQTTNIIYGMLNRTAWSVCLAWVVFACVTGYGGFVNSLLSWKAFIPLSRLTYSSYLVALDLQFIYWYSNKAPQYLDHTVIVYQFLGSLPIIFAVATIFSLAFESPMLALEKLIFPQQSRSAPAAAAPKEPATNEALLKDAKPGTVGQHGHTNKAFSGDGDGLSSSAEPPKVLATEDSANGREQIEKS